MQSFVGKRIRFLEPPHVTAHWIKCEREFNLPKRHHPRYGDVGVVVKDVAPNQLGAGVTVTWANGITTVLGSCSPFEVIE